MALSLPIVSSTIQTNQTKPFSLFLAGTDQVKDILESCFRSLTVNGHKPLWFHGHGFPPLHENAMTNCLKVVEQSSALIAVLDSDAGLPYRKSPDLEPSPITQEEVRTALRKGLPIRIYVRNQVWYASKALHESKRSGKPIDAIAFKSLFPKIAFSVAMFLEELMHTESVPWIIPFEYGEQVRVDVELFAKDLSNNGFYENRNQSELESDDILWSQPYSEKELIAILDTLRDDLPKEVHDSRLSDILSSVWILASNPIFASSLYAFRKPSGTFETKVLLPLTKLGRREIVTEDDIHSIIGYFLSIRERIAQLHSIEPWAFIARFIRHIFYSIPHLLQSPRLLGLLVEIESIHHPFLEKFFTDIAMRTRLGFLAPTSEAVILLERIATRFVKEKPDDVISVLMPILSDPLAFCGSSSEELEVNSFFIPLAERCTDVLDCKWCVVTLQRIIPILDSSEVDEHEHMLLTLIKTFPKALVTKSRILQKTYLTQVLLHSTIRSDLTGVRDFEKAFLSTKEMFHPVEVAHLQLEFAAALVLLVRRECVFEGGVMGEVKKGKEVSAIPLFENPLLTVPKQASTKLMARNSGQIATALTSYAHQLFTISLRHIFVTNPGETQRLGVARYLFDLRPSIGTAISDGLVRLESIDVNRPTAFYAQIIRAFMFVQRETCLDFMIKCLSRAADAADHLILQNAHSIFDCLYFATYYGRASDKDIVSQVATRLGTLLRVGEGIPRFWWCTFALIVEECLEKEIKFLKQIVAALNVRFDTQAVMKDDTNAAIIPDELVQILREPTVETTLIKSFLSRNLTNSEVWNLLGTTLNNLGDRFAPDYHVGSAAFYRLALWFGRGIRFETQKYGYNLIRAVSEGILRGSIPFSEDEAQTISGYLSRPSALWFRHRSECSESYFQLLDLKWNSISRRGRDAITANLRRVKWIEKKHHGRAFLSGGFGNMIDI